MTSPSGRPTCVSELAQYMEREIAETIAGLQASRSRYADSVDAPVAEDDADGILLGDTLRAEDDHDQLGDAAGVLADGIRKLPYKERRVLALRFRENLTRPETARRLRSPLEISRLTRRGTDRPRECLEQSQ
jgi:RNA polymerase sigma-B factor